MLPAGNAGTAPPDKQHQLLSVQWQGLEAQQVVGVSWVGKAGGTAGVALHIDAKVRGGGAHGVRGEGAHGM